MQYNEIDTAQEFKFADTIYQDQKNVSGYCVMRLVLFSLRILTNLYELPKFKKKKPSQ